MTCFTPSRRAFGAGTAGRALPGMARARGLVDPVVLPGPSALPKASRAQRISGASQAAVGAEALTDGSGI